MKLLEFEFKNILSYGNIIQSFKFKDEPQLILVEGENGAGKSSIKEALTVGIYGKSAIRKIKDIPNWINRNAYTNVKFITNSGEMVSISRGIDPNFSNIEVDNIPFNLPDKRKVDDFVEEELIKIPFSVFCNTISLSFDDFKSFVSLTKDDKRKIIDRIFGIDSLTTMRSLVKEDLKNVNHEIELIRSQISKNKNILDTSKSQLVELNKKIKENTNNQKSKLSNELVEKKQSGEALKNEYVRIKSRISNMKVSLSNLKEKISDKKWLLSDLDKKLNLYKKNRCPQCLNDLTTTSSKETLNKIKEKKEKVISESAPINSKILETNNTLLELEKEVSSAQSNYYKINAEVVNLNKKLNELSDSPTSDQSESIQVIINSINNEIHNGGIELIEKDQRASIYLEVDSLLSDNGIKKTLINKIIPTLNTRILEISERLNFKFSFQFNDDFDPVIQYLGLSISPKSLSSGQQKKMNLIVLLAFIEIIKMKHTQLNVMFLDEIFSSLDKNNIYLAIEILREYSIKYNMTIFVVSHESLPEEFFTTKLYISQVNHFSEIQRNTATSL
jgi:DNA repair exonuclease SbcCD ATPase subunit